MADPKDNLDPCKDTETAKARGKQGGKASGKARKEKKLMSQIYADFLIKEHDVIGKDGLKKKLSGQKLLNGVMSKVLARGDGSSVRLMKEIREGTEGAKINLEGLQPLTIVIENAGNGNKDKDTE